MDGISAAASVLGVIQVAAQVTAALGQYVASVRGAEASRKKLIDQITFISNAAKMVESVVQNSPPSLRSPEQEVLLAEWSKSEGPPARCKKALDDLLNWLEGQALANGTKRMGWTNRIKWPTKEREIIAAIQAFEQNMPYFRDVLWINTFNSVKAVTAGMAFEREQTRNNEITAAKRKLLDWFDVVDCMEKHEHTRKQRQQSTGEWLFAEQPYIDWRLSRTRFLWLNGKPGNGKSVLASAVIEKLRGLLTDGEILAYFYCDFRNPRSMLAKEVLRSLTVQLLRKAKTDWLPLFSDLVDRKEQGGGPPSDPDILADLMQRAAGLHDQPIVIIDALDECDDLSELLGALVKVNDGGHFRLFVTSRPKGAIVHAFTGLPSISLINKVKEVCDDIHIHIRTEIDSRDRLKDLEHGLQEKIRHALMRKADGMFRWVQCQLDRLNKCRSTGDMEEVLKTLPSTLYETYDRILASIDEEEFDGRVARRALVWLVTALKPLRISQLAAALAMNRDNPTVNMTAMIRETDILDVCGSLVCLDEQTSIVSLSHYSVKEYLTSPAVIGSKYFVHHPDASMELTSASIHCIILLSGKLPNGLIQAVFELSDYATIHGFQHLTGCIPEENDTILKLLFALQDQVLDRRRDYEIILRSDDSWLTMPQLALYIIIRFGHPSLLRYYIDHHSVQITTEFNPLVHAASTGNVSCLQMLLDEGLDVNAEGMHMGRNVLPLTAAVERFDSPNCEDVVRVLITYGSRVPEDIVHSALRNRCHPSVIRILLEHGADAKFLVDDHNTWFHTSLKMGFRPGLEIARLLVGAGCDPTTLINRGNSVFHFAIQGGDLEFVQWLIEQGFQPPPDAALHLHHGHCHSMLRLLIGHGISVQVKDGEGNTPLHLLLRGYSRFQGDPAEFHVEAVQLLIGEGCNVNSKNLRGDTPLHLAAEKRMLNIIDYLIDQGAHLPVDIVNRVALSPSPFYGFRTSLMKYFTHLVKIHGASVQARTIDGQTALQCLLRADPLLPFLSRGKRNEPAEEFLFLVDHGCDIHATTSSGVTLLQSAVVNGYATIVQYLLDRAAQLQVQAAEANGPLLELCSRVPFITEDEFIERVQLLQAAGYDVARHANTPNYRGFTPLQIVLAQPKHLPLAISHLLDIGAKFSGVKYLYLDNLNWASHLPWYHDAVQAHQAVLSRPKATSRDVSQVYHLLANHFRLPFSIARRVLDMAEYWAYESHVKTDVMCLPYLSARAELEPILLLPINSGAALVFSWKLLTFRPHLDSDDIFDIELFIKREGGLFRVPVGHPVSYGPNEPSLGSVGFCVWEHGLLTRSYGIERKELAVEDLIVGDALIAINLSSYTMFFEFFQVEVYYTLRE